MGYIPPMIDAAQVAAEALIALGFPVTPYGSDPDMDLWRIGDLIWTGHELIALAVRNGLRMPLEARR